METVLITGGSGIIGKRLSVMLKNKGYEVRHLSRSAKSNSTYPTFVWNLAKNYIDPAATKGVDHIIHLAGENVGAGRWTAERKKRIITSRVDTAQLLLNQFTEKGQLKSFISASGISYYGSVTTEKIFTEDDAEGSDYLAQVSVKWEEAAFKFKAIADRVIAFRTGVVLSPEGGALEKLVKPIKWMVGSPLGTGKQYVPWIHLDDICGIFLKGIMDNTMHGIYNAVAQEHCTNKQLTQAIAKVLGKKLWAPKVPAFAIRLLFGEMAVIVLEGSRIDNKKIRTAAYTFNYASLNQALKQLLQQ